MLLKQSQIEGGGTGFVTPTIHQGLDQLVHNVAEDSFAEYTYSGSKVTDYIIWTDSGKTIKIREHNFTYTGSKVNTETRKQYNAAGVVITNQTMTGTYVYSGSKVTDITWVIT